MESQVPSHLGSIHAILAVESTKDGIYHFAHGPEYDMGAYMATLFGGETRDSSWKLGRAETRTQLSTQVP
jgi:hypothetical protein